MIRRVTNFIEDWSLPALVGFTMLAPALVVWLVVVHFVLKYW